MLAKAEVKYLRASARKVRLVVELLRNKTVEEAIYILDHVKKGTAPDIKKVVVAAFSNLNSNSQDKVLEKEVCISKIIADGGPMLKRHRAATMGRATPIRHRTCHILVELDKVVETKKGKIQTESK